MDVLLRWLELVLVGVLVGVGESVGVLVGVNAVVGVLVGMGAVVAAATTTCNRV